jgi:hypothetical protein
MSQITHVLQDGHLVQVVSPAELKKELKRQGESLTKPRDWSEDDEWDVGTVRRTTKTKKRRY